MKYNDTTNKDGIIQQVERYINMGETWISGSTDRLREFTAYANKISRKVWNLIFLSQGVWQYDDDYDNLPQATTDLVSGQKLYALPTDLLTIKRLECKNNDDIWFVLKQVMEEQIPDAIDEWNDTDSQPVYYRLIGDTIELFPVSN